MKTRNWMALDASGQTGRPTGEIANILHGREYAEHPHNTITAPVPIGRLERDDDGLRCVPHNGSAAFPLDAAQCRRLVFDWPLGEHQASASGVLSRNEKMSLIGRAPAWAQRTLAEHLLPAEIEAHDRAQSDARVAQLQAAGRAARGGIPAQNSGSTAQSDRAAMLREVGRLASAR